MEKRKIIGSALFLFGTVLIFNSFSGITGFAVADNFGKPGSILGFVFVIVGLVVFVSRRKEKKELGDLLKHSKATEGRLRFDNIRDSLRYMGLKAKEDLPKKSKYQLFIEKNNYLDNEAAKHLFNRSIPNSSSEMVAIASDCGYRIEPDEGDGNRVYDNGDIITELGGHNTNPKPTQRGRLKSMAEGRSSFRRNNNI